jgi:hypothetical protein
MKKLIFLLFASVVSIILSGFPAYAQHQRLGIRPQEIVLDAEKPSKPVEAYCFDRHVIIDRSYDYRHLQTDGSAVKVIVGKKNYSFSNAIKEGVIEVRGRPGDKKKGEAELVIEITKLVPDVVTVRVAKTSVFRDTPGSYKNQKALDTLNSINASTGTMNAGGQSIQDLIWQTDIERSRRESLGYKSKDDFLKIHKLSSNTSDDQISAALKIEEDALIRNFEAVYIYARRDDTPVQSVSDNIRRLQQLYGVQETGVFGDDVIRLFKKYELEHLPTVKETIDLSHASGSYVVRVKSVIGDDQVYTVYGRFGAFRADNADELREVISSLSINNKGMFLDLEFPSPEKIEAFRTSMNIANSPTVTVIEGTTPGAKGEFFNSGKVTKLVSSSPVIRAKEGFRSTLTYKTETVVTNQKMTVTARARQTAMKFVQTFRRLVNGRRNVSSIVSEARRVSGPVTIGFDEVRRIRIIKLFGDKSFRVAG